jgi:hypothetical protein
MSSLVENLEKAAEANVALTALVAEAHTAIKTLRQTERDIKQSIKDIVDQYTADALVPKLEEMQVIVSTRLNNTCEHVLSEMKKIVDPCMETLEALDLLVKQRAEALDFMNDEKGSFFDR